ncbi:hypothetical protein ACTXGQ_15745 [Marinobacter sp. 1Y8]
MQDHCARTTEHGRCQIGALSLFMVHRRYPVMTEKRTRMTPERFPRPDAVHRQVNQPAGGNQEKAQVFTPVANLRIIRRLDFTLSDQIEATYRKHYAILEARARHEAAHDARQRIERIRQSQAAV